MLTALLCISAVLIDQCYGEPPRKWHPLVGFGWIASFVETCIYGPSESSSSLRYIRGVAAVIVMLAPAIFFVSLFSIIPCISWLGLVVDLASLYLSIGARSLSEHAEAVGHALLANKLPQARDLLGMIVSRDIDNLNEEQISQATVESVLENGCDAIFGALFWFILAGAPGVVLYRLANTLDAMWGYRTPRYIHFGWAAARLDDILNWFPARLTALSYVVISSNPALAWSCWREQAPFWKSPNAGPVMATGAGALGLKLGGPARYKGVLSPRPALGKGSVPHAEDIDSAIILVRRVLCLWLSALLMRGLLFA